MNREENIQAVIELLNEKYSDYEVSHSSQQSPLLECFYVELSPSDQYILKISRDCLDDHSSAEILRNMNSALQVMESNINSVTLLKTDFSVSVQSTDS